MKRMLVSHQVNFLILWIKWISDRVFITVLFKYFYILVRTCQGSKVAPAAECQCMVGPLAFTEFPAESTQAWEAGMGAGKHQTTRISLISSMRGSFCIWTHDLASVGGKACWAALGYKGHTSFLSLLKKEVAWRWCVLDLSVYLDPP